VIESGKVASQAASISLGRAEPGVAVLQVVSGTHHCASDLH